MIAVIRHLQRFFENKREQKTFDECWVQWVGSLVRIEAEYMCFFKIPEQKCADKIENKITAQEIKVLDLTQQLSEDIELIGGMRFISKLKLALLQTICILLLRRHLLNTEKKWELWSLQWEL